MEFFCWRGRQRGGGAEAGARHRTRGGDARGCGSGWRRGPPLRLRLTLVSWPATSTKLPRAHAGLRCGGLGGGARPWWPGRASGRHSLDLATCRLGTEQSQGKEKIGEFSELAVHRRV